MTHPASGLAGSGRVDDMWHPMEMTGTGDGMRTKWQCDGCDRVVESDSRVPEPCACGRGEPERPEVARYFAMIDGKLTQVATIEQTQ